MIVMKFGGSSLADARRLAHVARLVMAAPDAPCVVLSAAGGTTDELARVASDARADRVAQADEGLHSLFAKLRSIAGAAASRADLDALEEEGRALVSRIAASPGDPLDLVDALLSLGERATTAILAGLLRDRGADVLRIDARDVVRTDATFGSARPDRIALRDLAARHVRPHLLAGGIVVTEGFVGATVTGETTTLGRGGSDWSATLLGEALGAREVQVWTDVAGVHTADPRVVDGTFTVPELTPDEAAELAAFGARVLHPETMRPAVDAWIPVTVRHTAEPDGAFTRIDPRAVGGRQGVVALASRGPVTVLRMTSRRMLDASGYLARLFAVFGDHGVSIDLIATAEVSVSVTVEANAPLARLVPALEDLARVEVREGQAIVAAIGDSIDATERVVERACRALHPERPALMSYGGNARNLSLVVPEEHRAAVVRRLHAEFFPADVVVPTASPADLSRAAAEVRS